MEFHVAQLLREPVGAQRDYSVSERCDVGESSQIDGNVTLLRTDAGILATAALHTTVEATCSRCLAPAHVPVDLSIEEEYYPAIDVVMGAAVTPPDEATPFRIDEHHILDLCEAVRQQLIIAEPMQPLCKQDCAGLCPSCGADLNAGPCQCSAGDADSRWAALRDFIQSSER
jgi:DUF177 domain-containing protein